MVPRLIAAFGTQRDRYATASAMQCYAGIVPVVESSGKQKWVHWRWACPKFLRQTFHEWAWFSTRKSAWAKSFYDRQRERKKSYHAAIRALAFKWIRILFRCWKDGVTYDMTQLVTPRFSKSTVRQSLRKSIGKMSLVSPEANGRASR